MGHYVTSCSGATSGNYNISYVAGGFDVTKADLTITASSPADLVYGSAKPAVSPSFDGFVAGDSADDLGGTLACTTGYSAGSPVGHYVTSCSGATSGNYNISYVAGGFDVTKADLTITASSPADLVYGSAKPAVSPSFDGFVAGDSADDLGGTLACTTGYSAGSPVGHYVTSCSGATSGNYNISYVAGGFDVTKADLTITASSPADLVYGSAKPAVSPSFDGFVAGDSADDLGGTLACTTGYSAGSPVGHYVTSCSGATSGNYNISYVAGGFDVTKADLTITASSPADLVYGSAKPAVSPSFDGFVAGDSADDLGGTLACTTGYSAGSPVGHYVTSCSGATSGNYNISYVAGGFDVTKADLTITASSPADLVYGSAKPAVSPSFDGFVAGDSADDLGGTLACTTGYSAGSPVGHYVTSCSGATSGNYNISYVAGGFDVTKADLTITASSPADLVYGSAKPAVSPSFDGFVAGDSADDLGGTLACTTGYSAGSPVGHYVTSCSGATSGNYNISYVAGGFDVTKADLVVKADDKTKVYGDSNPLLTGSLTGVKNSDPITASYTTAATQATGVGSYTITAGVNATAAVLANYNLTTTNGTLAITKASLTVKADDKTKVYGDSNPLLTGSLTGVKNSDPITASYTTAATQATGVGSYTITAGVNATAAVLANYNLTTTNGTLAITKASLTVKADDKSMTLHAVVPGLTGMVTGVKNSDPITGNYSTAATSASGVGSYTITAGVNATAAVLANYDLAATNGTLTIMYAAAGSCVGDTGHKILQPINADWSANLSVFKQGSTVPAKFRVCDANGVSISAAGLVTKFALVQKLTLASNEVVDETVYSTTPDTAFRWDSSSQQWIFNIATKTLKAGTTYVYQVTLDDHSTIDFRFGLK